MLASVAKQKKLTKSGLIHFLQQQRIDNALSVRYYRSSHCDLGREKGGKSMD